MVGKSEAISPRSAAAGSTLDRVGLLLQLLATAAVIGWVPGNALKLALLLVIWALGFRRISRAELAVAGCVNILFIVMNSAALGRGIFRFEHPDLLGMPFYEFVAWGFYTLHTLRFIDGEPPRGKWGLALAAAVAFALPFAVIADPGLLVLVTAAVLVAALGLFHERGDLAYTGYMILLGALIEYVGVATGQWSYPGAPWGGVPPWFVTMWGGVGLFTRRLLLPILYRSWKSPRQLRTG